jgi:hypothetical protein
LRAVHEARITGAMRSCSVMSITYCCEPAHDAMIWARSRMRNADAS